MESEIKEGKKFRSPKALFDEIRKTVRSQEAAVRSISIAEYDQLVRPDDIKKSNVIIAGPSGTGKTLLCETASSIIGLPYVETKMSGHSSSGYVGTNFIRAFAGLYPHRKDENVNKAVVFLDEIDKISERGRDGFFDDKLQNEIIAWVESANVRLEVKENGVSTEFTIDTTGMQFIGAGAFYGLDEIIAKRLGRSVKNYGFGLRECKSRSQELQDLYDSMTPEDLIKYGFKPEMITRFPRLTYTLPLNREALMDIMRNSKSSVFEDQIRLLREGYDIDMTVEDEVYTVAADAALHLNTGARGIQTVTEYLFDRLKFDYKPSTRKKVHFDGKHAYETLKSMLPSGYQPPAPTRFHGVSVSL